MSDAEDLARRYLCLWQDYLTALMADPKEPGLLEFWIAACEALAGNRQTHEPVNTARSSGSSASTARCRRISRAQRCCG